MHARNLAQLGLALVAAGGAVPARADGSLRCSGGLVSTGDTAIDLLARCGEPVLREERVVEETEVVLADHHAVADERRTTAVVERWSYNFGPDSFIEIVTVEGGRVRHVRHGGYGYPPERLGPRPGPARCDPEVRVGDTSLDVHAKCGAPTYRDRREEERTVFAADTAPDHRLERRVTVAVETWMYDLGPDRFQLIATVENGRVRALTRGGYGHAR